jgi:hypothetical protein
MTNITKRLNFFTGFFTTAKDWQDGQDYHLERRKLHNRGLHTPGIMRGEREELRVIPTGGLNVQVCCGAALDSDGNEIYLEQTRTLTIDPPETLPQLVYIAIKYYEEPSDHVENVENSQYSGDTRIAEIPRLELTNTVPDNLARIELARIDLQPGVTEISAPADPQNPGGNEIDLRFVKQASSLGVAEEVLTPQDLERLIQLMVDGRRDFAALDGRFPVPSTSDVRHGAISLEMLARLGAVRPGQLGDVLAALAAVEQDVRQELAESYPALVPTDEFVAYRDAVSRLLEHIRQGAVLDTLLTTQAVVSEAARELSEIALRPPEADAGEDVTVTASEGEATVRLAAGGSQAFDGQEIVRYHWKSYPVADAGADRTVSTFGDRATLELNAEGSAGTIVRYHWDKKEE